MKVLIWFVCIFVTVTINVLIGELTGARAGQLITIPIVYFLATTLCRKWESHKEMKELLKSNPQLKEEIVNRANEKADL